MVYHVYTMLRDEINSLTWHHPNFNEEENESRLGVTFDMINDDREISHTHEFSVKQRITRQYNSNVIPREIKEGNFVPTQFVEPTHIGNLLLN